MVMVDNDMYEDVCKILKVNPKTYTANRLKRKLMSYRYNIWHDAERCVKAKLLDCLLDVKDER